jgi:hypothetical protein
MKRALMPAVAAALVLIALGPVWAQGKFTLEREEFGDSQNMLSQMAARRVRVVPADASSLKDLPEGVSDKAARFTISIAGREAPFLLDFAEDSTRLYADTDADGRLADEQPIALATVERTTDQAVPSSRASIDTLSISYRTFSLRAPGRSRGTMLTLGVDGWIQARQQAFLCFYPGARMSGTVTLDGKALSVALVDRTLDGRYDGFLPGSALGQPLSCDAIAFDLDGNGQFQPGRDATEVFDLSRMLRIGDGFYDVRPARDGSTLALKRVTPKMGTLDVDCPELSLMLISDGGTYDLGGNDGTWALPAGTYRLRGFELRRPDADGVTWRVFGSGTQGGALSQFEVRKGRTTRIPAGPPLTLASTTTGRGDTISINVDVVGRAGEHYLAGATKGDERLGAPTVVVVDRSGIELTHGAFSYG